MAYEIVLAPGAVASFKELSAKRRAEVRDALEVHLRREPTKVSKSRIKRLRGLRRPQYRLRVREIWVFYDVVDDGVQILGIAEKERTFAWLRRKGIPP